MSDTMRTTTGVCSTTVTKMVDILYHVTWGAYQDQIQTQGLLRNQPQSWPKCISGCVYLADDEELAVSFCEANDDVADDLYASGCVVFSVDIKALDSDLLLKDPNVIDESRKHYFAYYDDISPNQLQLINKLDL